MSLAADALGLLRLGAAVAMPREIAAAAASPGSWGPLCLFAIAATSDFVDGRLARATSRPTAHGALLDTVADVSFVLAATGSGAAIGLVPWAAPLAIVAAVAAYALASLGRSTRMGSWQLARSRLGHAGGVANYALAGVVGGALAWPHPAWGHVLRVASLVVVALNVAGVVTRIVPARQLARGPAEE